jgi:hypothetical protein
MKNLDAPPATVALLLSMQGAKLDPVVLDPHVERWGVNRETLLREWVPTRREWRDAAIDAALRGAR